MKNSILKCAFALFLCGISSSIFSQNVGINTSGTTPNSSALLDLNTGNTFSGSGNGKGVLIPNVALSSSTDASTITSPATSLMVYVPAGSGLTPSGFYYNSGTPASPVWTQVVTGTNTTTIFDHCTTVTNNASTGFVKISLPANSVCGGMVNLCIYATNGTDYQSYTNTLHFGGANKGGTITTSTSTEPDADVTAASSGNISTSYSVTTGTNMITINIDASSNLSGTVTVQACYIIFEYSGKTITEL